MPLKTIISLAILKVNWDSEKVDYIESFVPLFLHLFQKYEYSIANPEVVQKDFLEEYGLVLPLHPCITILGRVKKRGYIIKKNHEFIAVKEKIANIDFTAQIEEQARKFGKVINEFIDFAKEIYSTEITANEAEKGIISFFKDADISLLFNADESLFPRDIENGGKTLKTLFALFIREVKKSEPETFDLLVDVAIGHALANTILYDAKMQNYEGNFKGLKFYLDAGFIFGLLGTSGESIRLAYESVVGNLRQMGAHLYIFEHTYDEVMKILQGSLTWIENPSLDYAKAGRSLRYFLSQNFTESDVQLFLTQIPQRLSDCAVTRVPKPDFSQYRYQIDETALKDFIVDSYKKNDPAFDDVEKELTILKDIDSISAIYRLRKGHAPHTLKDAGYIFLTTNSTLAKVSSEFERSRESTAIPVCLTDVFVGTLIWLQSPAQAKSINERRIFAQVYGVLQPSKTLIRKYFAEVDKLKMKSTISEDDYYLLRATPMVMDILPIKALGNPDMLSDKTVSDILVQIKEKNFTESTKLFEQEKASHAMTRQQLSEAKNEADVARSKLQKIVDRVVRVVSLTVSLAFVAVLIINIFDLFRANIFVLIACGLLILLSTILGIDIFKIRSWLTDNITQYLLRK